MPDGKTMPPAASNADPAELRQLRSQHVQHLARGIFDRLSEGPHATKPLGLMVSLVHLDADGAYTVSAVTVPQHDGAAKMAALSALHRELPDIARQIGERIPAQVTQEPPPPAANDG